MKKIIIFSLFLSFVFSANLSSAASYPSTCPKIAQSILDAVSGGCSAIDCKTYSDICAKCCVKVTAPAKTTTPAPPSKPTTVPTSETKTVAPSTSSLPTSTPSIQENLPAPQTGLTATTTPRETATSSPKTEPIVSLIKFISSIFTGFFRLFGFGK